MPQDQTLAHPVEIATDIAVAIEDARNAAQSASSARKALLPTQGDWENGGRHLSIAIEYLESAILRLQAAQRGGKV